VRARINVRMRCNARRYASVRMRAQSILSTSTSTQRLLQAAWASGCHWRRAAPNLDELALDKPPDNSGMSLGSSPSAQKALS
jgi:hypothetical protein